uniref:deoxynucleoside kinase n=1 Tax=Prevotella sp. TaxID=59823 RepID=UPI003FEDC162
RTCTRKKDIEGLSCGFEVYIRSSIPHLIEHIQRRGRDYEQTIRIDYLRGLGERYEEWIKTYQGPMIIVDGDKNDFLDNPADFQRITEMIDERLYGLFPLDNKD